MSEDKENGGWHLDKRVPIALIITIISQTIGIVWWAASIQGRVDALSTVVEEVRQFKTSERLPVVEVQLRDLKEEVKETNVKLDKILDRLPQ